MHGQTTLNLHFLHFQFYLPQWERGSGLIFGFLTVFRITLPRYDSCCSIMHLACSHWCCKDACLLGFYALAIGKVIADILNDHSALVLRTCCPRGLSCGETLHKTSVCIILPVWSCIRLADSVFDTHTQLHTVTNRRRCPSAVAPLCLVHSLVASAHGIW